MLDLRRLSYFLAVASERSFTRAAERLHVAQPALSRQVKQLEDELGTPLLVRGGADGLEPTAAGRLLLERAPALLGELDALWEDAARLGGTADVREIHLGYAASAGYETATRIVGATRERDAGLRVRARVVCVADALDALRGGTLDAALLRSPPETDGLVSRVVRRELQGVLMHRDHPLAAREVVAFTALRDVPIVLHPHDANPGRYDAIVGACHEAGIEPEIREPLIAFDPGHQAVKDREAVTIIGGHGPDEDRAADLVWRPLAPALVLDLCLVTPVVADAPGVATLAATAQAVAEEAGWLEDPRRLKPAAAAADAVDGRLSA